MAIIEKRDNIIQDLIRMIDDLNATGGELTEKIRSVPHELGMVPDEIK